MTAEDMLAAVAELAWEVHENTTGVHEKLREIEQRDVLASHVTRIEVLADGEIIADLSFEPGRVIVGRSPDNEIYIKSKFVSRHHAQLISDGSGCIIEDLNSTNGVFLGERQVKKYRLQDGDVVSVGVHELVYHDLRASGDLADDESEAKDLAGEEPATEDPDSQEADWEDSGVEKRSESGLDEDPEKDRVVEDEIEVLMDDASPIDEQETA